MERSFFPIEIEARRELARIGLISKHHYHPQCIIHHYHHYHPLYKCIEAHPYYATQYQDIFFQYKEDFTFITGKASAEFKHVNMTIPNEAPSSSMYSMTQAGRLILKPNKAVFKLIATDLLLSKVETWYIIHGTTNGTQMLQIILELIVQVKILIANITSFVH